MEELEVKLEQDVCLSAKIRILKQITTFLAPYILIPRMFVLAQR